MPRARQYLFWFKYGGFTEHWYRMHGFISFILINYPGNSLPFFPGSFSLDDVFSVSQLRVAVPVFCLNGLGATLFSSLTTEVSSSLPELSAFRLRTFPFRFAFLKNVQVVDFSFCWALSSAILENYGGRIIIRFFVALIKFTECFHRVFYKVSL